MLDLRSLLVAAFLLLPVAVVGATSDLVAPEPAPLPGTEVVNVSLCPGSGLEVPLAVDECGDTMTGDLTFVATRGVAYPAGRLTGDAGPGLRFGVAAVCLSGVAIPGCGGGDITGVIAGSGLLGGGLAGDVTLAVDTSTIQARVGASCAAGQSIRVIDALGGVTCEVDDNSGGTVTSVTAGAGLAGGVITTVGTLSVANGGITSAMIQDGTVGTADITNGGVGVADINTNEVQQRVSGSCPADQAVRVISSAGTVTCDTDHFARLATDTAVATTTITLACVNYADAQVTISWPSSGRVVVDADAWLKINHVVGTRDMAEIMVGTTNTDCGSPAFYWGVHSIAANEPTEVYDDTVHLSRTFVVAGAGSQTYFLNGMMFQGQDANDWFWFAAMNAVFYPDGGN
ncbi:MAG TPA: hypothetical protein VGR28_00600 [Candidatus Thermoplasmatota archaeon]|jgi:hypothetical protein|nr:hypothetical protein [Candidatus Thermoplasmatota archaeon]